MSNKTKRFNSKTLEECPIDFLWGTLCESIYSNGSAKTLVNIQPNKVGVIQGVLVNNSAEEQPFTAGIGGCDLFCVFQRKPGFEGPIKESITLSSNISSGRDTEFNVLMNSTHVNFFHSAHVEDIPVTFAVGENQFRGTYVFNYLWNGYVLGSVPLYVDIALNIEKKQ